MSKIPIGTKVVQKKVSKRNVNSNFLPLWDGKVGIVVAHKPSFTGVYFADNYDHEQMHRRGHSLDGKNPHDVVGGWWFFQHELDILENKVQVDKKYEELYT